MSVSLDVDLDPLRKAIDRLPRVVNAELNRGLNRIARGFYQRFNPQLKGGGITVRRKVRSKKKAVPPEAAAMGFTARLRNPKDLGGKVMEMWSKSPVVKAHEFGATIRPRQARFLAIGEPPRPLRKKGAAPGSGQGRLLKLTRRVTIPARLGFYRTWGSYVPEAQGSLDKVAEGIEKRVEGAEAAGRGS